jgi:hypothetical protein
MGVLLTTCCLIVYPLLATVAMTLLARGKCMTTIQLKISPLTVRRTGLATASALLLLTTFGGGVSPARADRCDDLAAQLKSQIDGLTIGTTKANVIYLEHPAAKQVRLGCFSKEVTNSLYAASDNRKPSPAFLSFVASAAAVIFTIPKSDMLAGATRCAKRMGFFRGDDIKTRYRRLDMECTRSKTGSAISISRAQGE